MTQVNYHIPALLNETIDGLNINPDGIYVDVTYGSGGHSAEILNRLGDSGKLIAFDQDEDAMGNILKDNRLIFVKSNFRYLKNYLKYLGYERVDGILADLGVSFHHFDEPERGFSFRQNSSLDMRMNQQAVLTAKKIVNEYSQSQLRFIFRMYGELKNSNQVSAAIVKSRNDKEIETTGELMEILKPCFFREREKKEMSKAFQALRIEVNNEMEVLKKFLKQAVAVLKPEGRLAVLTYHSIEDRLVKNFIRSGNFNGTLEKDFYGNIIAPLRAKNNKVIVPSTEEIERNPRSRSAKLRIAIKK